MINVYINPIVFFSMLGTMPHSLLFFLKKFIAYVNPYLVKQPIDFKIEVKVKCVSIYKKQNKSFFLFLDFYK